MILYIRRVLSVSHRPRHTTMSTKLDNHVGQLNERFDTTDALVVEQAKHVIDNMGGSNALLGTYQASLIDGLKTALDANMAREGTAVQEAVKAEVHTINCNFDLVLHALRYSLEKQQQKVQWQKRMINTLLFVLWTVLCAVLSFVAGIGCAVAMKQGEIDPDNEHVIKVWSFVYPVLIPVWHFMRSWSLCQFMY